jgi:sterol desaturase/sphingolipid hydroxylase (fatty acid hydroxylase superfamily)
MRSMAPGVLGPLTPIAGGRDLSFFKITPAWVDIKKAPGFSQMPPPSLWPLFTSLLQLRPLWATPYLIWLALAAIVYAWLPYDLERNGLSARGPLTAAFFFSRVPSLLTLVLAYYGFWHVTLHRLGWAERSFVPDRPHNAAKAAHNAFFVTVGVCMWVAVENVMCFLWATRRLSFVPDAALRDSALTALSLLVSATLMPLWRAAHFYFSHRFIHIPALYRQVHSLHHRNTDIDCFAGLTMHPLEHLYYFAAVMPALFIPVSPFLFLFTGFGLFLSPAASHSGWEDAMQSDIHHFLHHRFLEVNYASYDAAVLDVMMGSFRGSLADVGEKAGEVKPRADEKSRLAVPGVSAIVYVALSIACFIPWYAAASSPSTSSPFSVSIVLSALAGFGPVLIAFAMPHTATSAVGPSKQGLASDAVHYLLGVVCCCVPVMMACFLSLT